MYSSRENGTFRVPANITLLHLTPYSPELNPVERLWAFLRSHYLSNPAYEDYNDLFNSCGNAWNQLTREQLCSICRTQWIPPMNLSESVLGIPVVCLGSQESMQQRIGNGRIPVGGLPQDSRNESHILS